MHLIPLLLTLILLSGCASADSPRLALLPVADFPGRLAETSGLIAWRDGFISHNDSGNEEELFRLDAAGQILAVWPLAGVYNRDWEDITLAGDTFYLADIGNNGGHRQNLVIYQLDAETRGASLSRILPVRYAEQLSFMPAQHQHNFDAEALTWVNGELWLLTKRWLDEQTALYKLDPTTPSAPLAEQQRLNTRMLVTAADYDADSQTLILLGYGRNWLDRRAYLWLYPVRDGHVIERQGRHFILDEGGQFEGVALGADGHIYLTREGRRTNLFRSRQPLARLLTGELAQGPSGP
ncbi:SdiA-regulated domain-containing protein [Zobellella maritima]|uniref:SdiA-regulated domain-containing protein n=1 Tax=Zobellella maritima TaxID=2059725 RepID=UPI000E306048|nr:SdiA-regulated domain-containing protein [Zobellella maritima]